MSTPFWDEYARLQARVEAGRTRDDQLDAMLRQLTDSTQQFDLYDCRRRLKNHERNHFRRDRKRLRLLENESAFLQQAPTDQPWVATSRREIVAAVTQTTRRDGAILWATLGERYAAAAADAGVSVGTIKSRVSRARGRLRPLLIHLL